MMAAQEAASGIGDGTMDHGFDGFGSRISPEGMYPDVGGVWPGGSSGRGVGGGMAGLNLQGQVPSGGGDGRGGGGGSNGSGGSGGRGGGSGGGGGGGGGKQLDRGGNTTHFGARSSPKKSPTGRAVFGSSGPQRGPGRGASGGGELGVGTDG